MSLTHLESEYDHFYNPRFEVQVGTRTIREADGVISGLTIETSLDRTNRVSFTLNEWYNHEQGSFVDFTNQNISKGTPVVVKIGYDNTFRTMFFGNVESVQPSFPEGSGPTVEVSGNDFAHEMTKGKHSRSWTDTKLSSVVTDIVSKHTFNDHEIDLSSSADLQRQKLFQHEQSDYTFLDGGLVRRYGFELFVKAGVLHFREPAPLAEPVISLTYGRSLRSFRPSREDTGTTVGKVEVRDWNPSTKHAITATASVPNGGDETDVRRVPVESQREAALIAEAIAYDLTPGGSGRCETIGLPEIREGTVVHLDGLGETFSGPYYVKETTHRMDDTGYTTSFGARDASVFEVSS